MLYRSVLAAPAAPFSRIELFERAGSYSRRIDDLQQWVFARLSPSGFQITGQTSSSCGASRPIGPDGAVSVTPVQAGPVASSPSARYQLSANGAVTDFDLGLSRTLGFETNGAAFDRHDRWLAVASPTATLLPGGADTNGVSDVFVVDLPNVLDGDDDGLDDLWESFFQATDPAADLDADGASNAQESAAGTNPRGGQRRYLAEGATGDFFHTVISLANPDLAQPATAVLTFDTREGARVRRNVIVPAGRSTSVHVGGLPASRRLKSRRLSTAIGRLASRATCRGTTGGRSRRAASACTSRPLRPCCRRRGSSRKARPCSASTCSTCCRTRSRPRRRPPCASCGRVAKTITRTYDLPPASRTTIHVNDVPGLEDTDVAGDVSATAPIVAERSMYRSTPQEPLRLGHASMGVPSAATEWFLAEGATGAFFDLYVLIANPSAVDADVQVRFAKPDGSTVTRQYAVRAHSRQSIYVDDIPDLANSAIATTVTSTNAVPIVVERAMYWPGGFFDYYESHGSAGSTSTARRWVVAGAESSTALNTQSFVLIANPEDRAGTARLTFLNPAPLPAAPPIDVALPPNSRTTVAVPAGSVPSVSFFGVLVESVGGAPVDLVVESAVYRTLSGGPLWNAGGNALATPLP